jgi:hypothetical protein
LWPLGRGLGRAGGLRGCIKLLMQKQIVLFVLLWVRAERVERGDNWVAKGHA